jgi:hypothetical protein
MLILPMIVFRTVIEIGVVLPILITVTSAAVEIPWLKPVKKTVPAPGVVLHTKTNAETVIVIPPMTVRRTAIWIGVALQPLTAVVSAVVVIQRFHPVRKTVWVSGADQLNLITAMFVMMIPQTIVCRTVTAIGEEMPTLINVRTA